jgi:hypothetical protein
MEDLSLVFDFSLLDLWGAALMPFLSLGKEEELLSRALSQ